MQTATAPAVRTGYENPSIGEAVQAAGVFSARGAPQSSIYKLSKHEMLFSEGDAGGRYYEVLDGVVCSFRILHDGRRQILSFSYPGDIVGIGHEQGCKCSCEAVKGATLRCISATAPQTSVEAQLELTRKLLDVAKTELAGMHDHFVMVGRKSSVEKIASFLLALARRADKGDGQNVTFQLPMTRTDIADFLGLTIETVSRRLTMLRKLGVIDLPQITTVHVRDMARLEELAEVDEEDDRW